MLRISISEFKFIFEAILETFGTPRYEISRSSDAILKLMSRAGANLDFKIYFLLL